MTFQQGLSILVSIFCIGLFTACRPTVPISASDRVAGTDCASFSTAEKIDCYFDMEQDEVAYRIIDENAAAGDAQTKHLYFNIYWASNNAERRKTARSYAFDLAVDGDELAGQQLVEELLNNRDYNGLVKLKCVLKPDLTRSSISQAAVMESRLPSPSSKSFIADSIARAMIAKDVEDSTSDGFPILRKHVKNGYGWLDVEAFVKAKC